MTRSAVMTPTPTRRNPGKMRRLRRKSAASDLSGDDANSETDASKQTVTIEKQEPMTEPPRRSSTRSRNSAHASEAKVNGSMSRRGSTALKVTVTGVRTADLVIAVNDTEGTDMATDLELPTYVPSPSVSVSTWIDRIDLTLEGARGEQADGRRCEVVGEPQSPTIHEETDVDPSQEGIVAALRGAIGQVSRRVESQQPGDDAW
ncbi:LOW QUALITY PROTEIN: hypothetical protein PHMEG_00032369 [Phytophthora megakarya]|uniref:Uncharacterized protein n=1 Tax=Phytophthora megakarya TaxID=4795 RepID=A0A225UWJ3_9STRA|nr:LOW QUALITY PROTEIN: hypothetical protein PHMEG_00032369 [Phytophthora megakarya]